MNLFDLWLRFVKWGFVIAFPVMIVFFISLPVVDRLSRWQEAEAAMDEKFGDGIRLCVGIGSSSAAAESEKQRSYILMNRLEVATVFGSSTGLKQVVRVEASRLAFWFVLVFVISCLGLLTRFSIPRISAKIKSCRAIRCAEHLNRSESDFS